MPKYLLKVADKKSGLEVIKEFKGVGRASAQDSAIRDGWLLAEPTVKPLPKNAINIPVLEDRPAWWSRFWNAEDPAERAIVRGVCKAYCLIVLNTFVWGFVLAVVIGLLYAVVIGTQV